MIPGIIHPLMIPPISIEIGFVCKLPAVQEYDIDDDQQKLYQ